MFIDKYIKQWCDEDYNIKDEAFHLKNARYMSKRAWAKGGWKAGIAIVFISIFAGAVSSNVWPDVFPHILYSISVLTVAYILYGMREYNANSLVSGLSMMMFTTIFLYATKPKIPPIAEYIFSAIGIPLFLKFCIVDPIRFVRSYFEMKKEYNRMDEEEEKKYSDAYKQWQYEYQSYRQGLPEFDVPKTDPMMDEARALFEDYQNSPRELKTRFRQLAKQMHPDQGGDAKMFQCILDVYNELVKRCGTC